MFVGRRGLWCMTLTMHNTARCTQCVHFLRSIHSTSLDSTLCSSASILAHCALSLSHFRLIFAFTWVHWNNLFSNLVPCKNPSGANRVVGGTRIRIGIKNCTRFQRVRAEQNRRKRNNLNDLFDEILADIGRFSVLPFDRCFRLYYISSSAATAATNMFQYLILFYAVRKDDYLS